jgi:cobyrinic acid a,c-diamide synthase
MSGVFPIRAEMNEARRALGYREITTKADTLLGPTGTNARGHEFHYSAIKGEIAPEILPGIYSMTGRKGTINTPEGFQIGNTLGSYVHLHFGSQPEIARAFVAACKAGRAAAED